MANNCLVTKLKSIVQNDNLITPDEMLFYIVSDSLLRLGNNGENIKVTSLDSISFDVFNSSEQLVVSGVTSYTGSGYITLKNFSGTGRIKIDNKYSIKIFRPDKKVNYSASELKYLNFDIFQVYTYDSTTVIAFSELPASITNITTYSGVTGDIKNLGNKLHLSYFEASSYKNFVTGEFLNLIATQIANTRTTGSITGAHWNAFTFDGDSALEGSYAKVEWSPISGSSNYSVTCQCGSSSSSLSYNKTVNITVNSDGTWTKVS